MNALAPTLPRRAALRRSFGEAAADHLTAVHRYLLVLTADPSLAEDLTAETFERALRSWRRFDPRRGSERTWLCRIGRSVAVDHFRAESRRRRREERYALAAGGEEAAPVELGFSPELEAALRSLTAAEREVVALLLHTREAPAAAEEDEGEAAGAARDALRLLGEIGIVALFLAIVLAPVLLLAVLVWLALRSRSHRIERRLLDRPEPAGPQSPRG